MYDLCMARVNISMPDQLYSQARSAGLNVSHLAQDALAVEPVDEQLARAAAGLRTAAGGSPIPSAVDALVVAQADLLGGATVLTGDPRDLRRLAAHTTNTVRIATD